MYNQPYEYFDKILFPGQCVASRKGIVSNILF